MKKTIAILAAAAGLSLSATPAMADTRHNQWVEIQSFSSPIYRSGSAAPGQRGPNSLAGPGQPQQAGLLLPAVQAAREAARRNQSSAPGGLPNRFARQTRARTPVPAHQDGNDLLIVNNGDGSDF